MQDFWRPCFHICAPESLNIPVNLKETSIRLQKGSLPCLLRRSTSGSTRQRHFIKGSKGIDEYCCSFRQYWIQWIATSFFKKQADSSGATKWWATKLLITKRLLKITVKVSQRKGITQIFTTHVWQKFFSSLVTSSFENLSSNSCFASHGESISHTNHSQDGWRKPFLNPVVNPVLNHTW